MKTWIPFRHPAGRPIGLLSLTVLAAGLQFSACSDTPPTTGDPDTDNDTPTIVAPGGYGGECNPDGSCDDGGICQKYSTADADAFCTMQCATDEDCPADGNSSCISLTSDQGLTQVCVPSDLCIDPDNDGYGSGPGCKGRDCDQSNPNIHPGAPEYCNGIDNNCNGTIDDNAADVNKPCSTGFSGVCAEGWTQCVSGTIQCGARILPNSRREICDGLDNDCDGFIDEAAGEVPDDTNYVLGIGLPCGNPDTDCFGGYQQCNSEEQRLECSDPVETLEIPDLCDGIDNNCDGRVDEDANDPNNLLGTPCAAGIGTCRAVAVWSCNPDDPAAEPICSAVAIDDNAIPEVCDYTDNDCDGEIDNGFRNASGVYHTEAHCGRCNNSCADRWNGNAAAVGIAVSCVVASGSASCVESCLPGRYDLDKRPDNGCEFEPDTGAIYVATAARGGADGETCGDFQAPCRTIKYAVGRAEASSGAKPRVRVSEGIFQETLDLVNGISVIGGHSSRNWLLDPTANVSTIQGHRALGAHVTTIYAESISAPTEFSGFTVDAGDASAGGNSYAIYITGSGSGLTVKDNIVLAGRGGVGATAGSGTSGATGGSGGRGLDRVNDTNTCSGNPIMAGGAAGTNSSCGDIRGGQGAIITVCPSTGTDKPNINNSPDGQAEDGNGTAPGTGGRSTSHTTAGSYVDGVHGCASGAGSLAAGTDGGAGTDGNAGAGAANQFGSTQAGHWRGTVGGAGAPGTAGSGGGGGGSSGGVYDNEGVGDGPDNPKVYHYGPTGGGGGAGGCGGTAGQGGAAGGASFGIFVAFSGNTSNIPSITGNTITRNTGGRGGTGGAGGAGGSGGAGGEGGLHSVTTRWSRCGDHAARGGAGGRGGHGGGGGGGAGGVSYDIATTGNSNNAVNAYQGANSYTQSNSEATGGQGGAGGTAIVNPGAPGATGASGNFRRF